MVWNPCCLVRQAVHCENGLDDSLSGCLKLLLSPSALFTYPQSVCLPTYGRLLCGPLRPGMHRVRLCVLQMRSVTVYWTLHLLDWQHCGPLPQVSDLTLLSGIWQWLSLRRRRWVAVPVQWIPVFHPGQNLVGSGGAGRRWWTVSGCLVPPARSIILSTLPETCFLCLTAFVL